MKVSTLILAVAFTFLFQACSSSNGSANVPTPPPINLDNAMKHKNVKMLPVHEQTHQRHIPISPRTAEKSLVINGIKMQPEELPVVMGTRIFDVSVNQYARTTGDIIIVTEASSLPRDISTIYNVSAIAKNTYKLKPNQKDADLYKLYLALREINTIKRVELSIFYEGINETQLEVK